MFRPFTLLLSVTLIVLLFAGACSDEKTSDDDTTTTATAESNATDEPDETTAPTDAPTAAPTEAPTAEPTAAVPSFGDGTHTVGTEMPAGRYRAQAGGSCYWERLSGFGGSFDEIIANSADGGPQVVDIAATDAGFSSQRCGSWTPASAPITSGLSAPFEDGTFIVGTDIGPGTWKADGGDLCYWERLTGFSGGFDDIIANSASEGAQIVTIAASDVGFSSQRCGTWSPS